jgi:hypothetical protein
MKRALLVLALLSCPIVAQAQTVVNPTAIEFTASPTHNSTDPLTGEALLTRYDAKYYLASACNPTCPTTTPAFTINLAKPAPVAGKITVSNVFQGLVLNTPYKAVVVAVGPGGTSPQAQGDLPFGNRGPLAPPAPVSEVAIK